MLPLILTSIAVVIVVILDRITKDVDTISLKDSMDLLFRNSDVSGTHEIERRCDK